MKKQYVCPLVVIIPLMQQDIFALSTQTNGYAYEIEYSEFREPEIYE